MKRKIKVLLLLENIDWSCFWSGGRNVASSPRMWLDFSLPTTKHLWTWGNLYSGGLKENTKEWKRKGKDTKKKYKVFNQTSMEMGKPAARCKNQNVLRDVKYACKWIQLLNDFLRPKSIVAFFNHKFFQDQVYQKSALSCLLDVYKYNLNVQDSLTRFKCLCEKIPTKIHKYQEMQKYSKTKKETMGCLKIQLKCAGRFDRVQISVRENTNKYT